MMQNAIDLRAGSPDRLCEYVVGQLAMFFPNQSLERDYAEVSQILIPSLEKMRPILSAVKIFKRDQFNHFHSLQYASFLYLLSVESAKLGMIDLADRFFYLNKSLNCLDLYHQVKLGSVFFISHGIGSVLGNAVYGDRIVFFQNVTVGRVGNRRPTIGDNVILFPGSSVTGSSVVGNNCAIASGVAIHNTHVPDGTVAFKENGKLKFREATQNYIGLYLG